MGKIFFSYSVAVRNKYAYRKGVNNAVYTRRVTENNAVPYFEFLPGGYIDHVGKHTKFLSKL